MSTQPGAVPRLKRPYDPEELDDAVKNRGAAILVEAYSREECETFLTQVSAFLRTHPEEADYAAGSVLASFQGETTSSLHALIGRVPCAASMVLHEDLLGCARRLLRPKSSTVLMTVAEYMARRPGAPRQELHRDTFSWRHVPVGEHPIALTVMAAMSPFTAENGGTWAVLDSHGGPATDPAPDWSSAVQAEMGQGDALMFRADLFHAGGANHSDTDVRHIFSTGYQVGWLRTVDNGTLSVPPDMAAELPEELRELLGYVPEDVLGLYKGGDPGNALAAR
ncbi:phytanoyl-CoA dioxygenase family protein [Nonomuraea terrae]|uniref:phytanoyl-CoA dioxygenase family protein n=1 Tax=Nonomuraea terrae TaxID=2530383 RepID=UPI0037B9ED63